MIAPEVRAHIDRTLAATASEAGVRILYAAESGSRAWGFGSPDSDYDVRFLYAHPADWYVRLEEGRDVIERPLDAQLVDLAAWDIRKALRLLLRSNPALYEWLVSPIPYIDDGTTRPALKAMFEAHASQKALAFHYWSIARSHWRREIEGSDQVKLKKYLYLVRPLLSLAWVVDKGVPPPMHMDALLDAVAMPAEPRAVLGQLIETKRDTPELGLGPHLPAIDNWAMREIERLDPARLALSDRPRQDMHADADRLYRHLIGV